MAVNPMTKRIRQAATSEELLKIIMGMASRWKSYTAIAQELADELEARKELVTDSDELILFNSGVSTLRTMNKVHQNVGVTIRSLLKSRKGDSDAEIEE